jgi:hypothetical protein
MADNIEDLHRPREGTGDHRSCNGQNITRDGGGRVQGTIRRRAIRLGYAFAALLLILHSFVLAISLPKNAVTITEFMHLPAGIAYWQRGEFWRYHVSDR